jgi:phosphoglucosamine mutase
MIVDIHTVRRVGKHITPGTQSGKDLFGTNGSGAVGAVQSDIQPVKANIGGEQSGHVIFLDYATTGDGELSGVQLLKTVVKSGKKLSQLAKIMTVYPQVLINVQVTPEGKQKYNNDEYIISAVQQAEMDLMGDGRVLVRVSGTEPLVRVMLEGKDLEKITRLGNRIADVVRERLS